MKRIIKILFFVITVVMMFFAVSTFASAVTYSGYCGEGTYLRNVNWSLDTESGELRIGGYGSMADYSTQDNTPPWYGERDKIKTISIGDDVSIGSCAFYDCDGLTSINCTDYNIADYAFYDCDGLTSVTIGRDITSMGRSAFADCNSLESVKIGSGITMIDYSTFNGCSSLKSIVIPKSVTKIKGSAFSDCTSLGIVLFTGSSSQWYDIAIEEYNYCLTGSSRYYESIGIATHEDYTYVIPAGGVKETAICDVDSSVSGDIAVPSTLGDYTVTSIGSYAFADCVSLTGVTIPDSVTSVGSGAFDGCYNLTSAIIPESVTYIASDAFKGYTHIKCYKDSYAESYAEDNGFTYCFIDGTEEENTFSGSYGKMNWSIDRVNLILSIECDGKMPNAASATAVPWNAYLKYIKAVVFSEKVQSIGSYMFSGCTGLTSVTLPDGVTSIGNYAFYGCSDLEIITIPDGVTTIGNYAFYDCYNLKSITIPDGVTSIGNYAFYDCSDLEIITIPDSVTSIGEGTFYNCQHLTSVTIGNSVTTIGEDAFYDCDNLISVTIGNSVTNIGADAFCCCINLERVYAKDIESWLKIDFGSYFANPMLYACELYFAGKLATEVVIPDGVTNIGDYAFYSCGGLTSVTISDSVTSIGVCAFKNCVALASVTIPDSVKTIGDSAFYNCYSLESVTIPDGVTSIGDYAFYDCSGLTSVTVGNSVTNIGDYAFYDCYWLAYITLPDSLKSIGICAFAECEKIKCVLFSGNVEQWEKISIGYMSGLTQDALCYEAVGVASTDYYTYVLPVSGNNKTTICDVKASVSGDVTIPSTLGGYTVTAIGYSAFGYCNSLTSITIPDSVKSIGNYAFNNCDSLESITIPGNVKTIGHYAFKYCDSLESVVISDGVRIIGAEAFYYCESLTSIAIPESITKIGSNAFVYCDNLKNVKSDSNIYLYAENVETVELTYNVSKITSDTLKGYSKLSKLYVYNSNCEFDGVSIPVNTEIYGFKGSTAEVFADDNGMLFFAIDDTHEHDLITQKAATPTCTEAGLTEGKYCSLCGKVVSKQEKVPATGHTNKTTTTKATLSENGSVVTACTVCGVNKSAVTLYYPKTIALSASTYNYSGKAVTPGVTVKNSNGTALVKNTDYTVTYQSGRTNPGKYKVVIAFKGNYSGSKTLTFSILPQMISKIAAAQNTSAVKLAWTKSAGASGYRVFQYNSTTKKWMTVVKSTRTTSAMIQNLAAGTAYIFAVRPYYNTGTEIIWANYTKITTATRCATPSLKLASTAKGRATVAWTNVAGETGYQLYYSTSASSGYKKIANYKVNSKSTYVTGLTSGRIYYFRVRAYKAVGGTYVYSAFSPVVSVKIK